MMDSRPAKRDFQSEPSLKDKSGQGFSELALVESKLAEILGKANGIIKDTCTTLLHSGGKRIRPLLTLHSGMCFGPLKNTTIYAAVAAELIHMASLIHDDVIDNSNLRRGHKTINSRYGNQVAVLTGDYLFAEAFHILSTHQLLQSMSYLVEAIQAMCDGEVNQAGEQFSTIIDSEMYFARIAKKTGILLASCCKAGAATAGATQEEITLLGNFGLNLGFVYQIVDDILDFTANSATAGKPVGADMQNGNITLPVVFLMENRLYGHWIKEIIQTRKIGTEEFAKIRQVLLATDSLEKAFVTAQNFAEKAISSLTQIPPSPSKTHLIKLTEKVLYRRA